MISFILLNVTVAAVSSFILRAFFPDKGLADRICKFSVIFLAQVIFSELILGLFGALFVKNLILFNFLILLFFGLASRGRPVLPARQFRPGPAGSSLDDFGWAVENKTVLFCLSGILGFFLVKCFFNLINPPFGWDSLNYHFTFPVEWFKSGTLYNPPTISDDPTPTYYPVNNCLIYYWLIAPLKNVFLADLGQAPFYLLAFLACYSIARKFDLSKELSFYAGGLFVIIPNFFKQVEVGYADIMMGALFLVALNLLLILSREFNLKNLILSGIALGLFFGTKTLSAVYSAVLVVFLAVILFKNLKGLKLWGYAFLFFMLMLVFGGYGYIRNFIISGNPLFPLHFVLFGKTIFKGVMPNSTYLVRWTSEGYNLMKLFFHEGMGVQLFLLIFPAAFLALPVVLWKKGKKKLDFSLVYFLLLPLVLYLVFRYIIPQRWTRFLYPFLGTGSAVAIYTLRALKAPLKAIKAIVVICFLAAMAEAADHAELIFSFIAAAACFFLLPGAFKLFKREKARLAALVSAVVILPLGFNAGQSWYLKHEYQRYIDYAPYWQGAMQAWKWLNDNTGAGARIAYTGRPVPFPMYGTNFKNDVYYVSVNETHPAQLHFFPQGNLDWKEYRYDKIDMVLLRDENYRGKANFNSWYKNIIKENTDYLFVYILEEGYAPIEDKWAKTYSEKFEQVFSSSDANIYKVVKK